MARTYRLRRLTKPTAKHYIDADLTTKSLEFENEIWREIAHVENDYPCSVGEQRNGRVRHGWKRSHFVCLPRYEGWRQMGPFRAKRRWRFFPVRNLRTHPYLRYHMLACVRNKAEYKRIEHRAVRTLNRRLLRDDRTWNDDWDGSFARHVRNIGWNWW